MSRFCRTTRRRVPRVGRGTWRRVSRRGRNHHGSSSPALFFPGARRRRAGVHRVTTIAPPSDRIVSVLIVEDDFDTADSLARFLRLGCGYTVATAPDGRMGVRMAVEGQPDVVVCDIGLPKLNGLLVAEELTMSLLHRPLLIAVTGYAGQVSEGLAQDAGFDHFLLKPADPFRIEALIEDHLRHSNGSTSSLT